MDLHKHFDLVKDFRVQGRNLHDLVDILVLVLCGTIADCSDFAEIEDYGKDKELFLKNTLGLSLPNGIPSQGTLWRVIRYLASDELEKSLQNCARDLLINLSDKHLIIDGKAMRGTIPKGKKQALVQVVSLWLEEEKLSFAQLKVSEKSNEITAIPKLLDKVFIKDSIVSIDAIACQKEITKKIIDKEADYLIALKKNQGYLYEQCTDWLKRHKKHLVSTKEHDVGHGRVEERKVYICQDLHFLETCQEWEELNTIILVESTRIIDNKEEKGQRFYISSLKDKDPKKYAKLIRGHWAIENGLHWQLDITFKEDYSQVKLDNGALNLNIFRKFALFLLSKDKTKMSMKRKRKKAARDDKFLSKILKYA